VNEVMKCQAKALARKMWPGEFDAKPDLKLVRVNGAERREVTVTPARNLRPMARRKIAASTA
jgi:hypothetical protein